MLDGAARIPDVVARAVADGQPAVGITDHGNMYGVLDFYHGRACGGRQAGHRRPRRTSSRRAGSTGRAAPSTTSTTSRCSRRATRATATSSSCRRRPTSTATSTSRASTSSCSSGTREGIVATSGCLGERGLPGARRATTRRRARARGPLPRRPRPRLASSSSSRITAWPSSGASTRAAADRARSSISGCSPRTTATTRTGRTPRRTTRSCACRPGARATTANRLRFDSEEFYLKTAAEMRSLFRDYEEACDNTLLVAERAEVEIEFGNAVLPAVPDARRSTTRTRTSASSRSRARRSATADPLPAHVAERIEYELGRHQDDGLLRVLPRRLGPRAVRP